MTIPGVLLTGATRRAALTDRYSLSVVERGGGAMAEPFTVEELEELRDRALELGSDEADASLRAALQLLGEAADNLVPKVHAAERTD